ncbi:protocadherin Fat 4 isoform X2 [Folsomia candida]|uniref:protocadherin Fat 4 isoform X2 n=1 Tax=Folsomia candida TaxID=158441 RepID=UPI001604F0F4|nr:protocadherin Fat 4 isoform X2 [Folsomia candida]
MKQSTTIIMSGRKLYGTSLWIWSSLQFAVVFSIIVHSKSDSRCFLVNGGSSVSFFVSEDVPIGSNLGTLDIHGDINRDIALSLSSGDSSAPVQIEPGTKNITLTRKLDREGIEGPSSVTFTVLCDKRNDNEPSIHIPVTIRTKDVNDNAPRIVGGPFRINVSEQTLPGSSILSNIKAIDMDQHGSPYSTLTFSALEDSQGKPSKLVTFAGGGQEGRLILIKPLDYETRPKFNVTLRVSDQGTPPLHTETIVEVRVVDADDQNPRFQHVSYSSLLPRNPRGGAALEIEPEPIYAFDQDTGINSPIIYSIAQGRAESNFFHMDALMGRITLSRDVPEDQLNQPITLVLKAEQKDNPDRYAISTLNVGKKGNTNAPLHFVQPEFSVGVPENSPIGTIVFTALTSRQADKRLRFGIEGDPQGIFQIVSMGQLVLKKSLDYEVNQRHVIKLWVTDGFQNSSATGIINVLNVNDWAPRFRQSLYEFNVTAEKLSRGTSIGQIEVADGDVGDKLTLEIKNSDSVHVDENGQLYLRNKTVVKREMMFIVVAKDTGEPPREAFVPVLIRLVDMPSQNDDVYLQTEVDIKLIIIAAFAVTVLGLVIGILLYFGYCRKRRKIETENFHKRVLERNISNPLAIHKMTHPGDTRGLTPVDPITNGHLSARHKNVTWSPKVVQKTTPTPPARSDTTRVTTMPKSQYLNGMMNGHANGHGPLKGLELDPDTSVTPLETYRSHVNLNGRHPNPPPSSHSPSDTMHSNTSLTLYF